MATCLWTFRPSQYCVRFKILLLKSCLFSLCVRKLSTHLCTQILLQSVVLCVTIYRVMAMITMTSKHTGPPYLALLHSVAIPNTNPVIPSFCVVITRCDSEWKLDHSTYENLQLFITVYVLHILDLLYACLRAQWRAPSTSVSQCCQTELIHLVSHLPVHISLQ